VTLDQLIGFLPESIVVVTVMLFLWYQHQQDIRLNKISERCHNTQIEIQKGYQDSLNSITEAHLTNTQAITDRMSSIEHNVSDLVASINQMIGKMK